MAQGDQRFSHISVSAGDEDDVVIVAGDTHADAPSRPVAASDQAEPAHAPAHVRMDEGEPGSAPRKAAPAKPEAPASAPAARKGASDRYEETTLEDLQGTKMSTMQKAIIVIAVIGVIAFAVYYMFLR